MEFPTLTAYKLAKLWHDYDRAHACMREMSPDHQGFRATRDALNEMRRVADDLAADAISAWDALLEEIFHARGVPPGRIKSRLAALEQKDNNLHSLVTDAWSRLLTKLNDVRNEYQHSGFWMNSFGYGQGNGPFSMDLIAHVNGHQIFILRDVRRAAWVIEAVHKAASLETLIPFFANPCLECYGDVFIGPPLNWERLVS